LELGNKDSLQRSYGNQAVILQAWGRLEEALALLKKQEAICLELGNKSSLAYCYWNWGRLERALGNAEGEQAKLSAAFALFGSSACLASETPSKQNSSRPGQQEIREARIFVR